MSNRPPAHPHVLASQGMAATPAPAPSTDTGHTATGPEEGLSVMTQAPEEGPATPPALPPALPAGLVPAAVLTHALPRAGTAAPLPVQPGAALGLARGRVHEICGPGRRTLALLQAGAAADRTGSGAEGRTTRPGLPTAWSAPPAACGPVIWIAPGWAAEALYAPGVARLIDPGRLLLVPCPRREDLLWAAEEALRAMATAGSGAVVVVELTTPPGLTPVRRLHLAASGSGAEGDSAGSGAPSGKGTGQGAPLGLLLTPGTGGAAGVETRWHLVPDHGPDRSAWSLQRLRARGAGPAAWRLTATAEGGHHLTPTQVHGPPPPAWGP